MKKEFGILDIKKADPNEVKKIKKYNNLIIHDIVESSGYSIVSGFTGGITAALVGMTLMAFRDNAFYGTKVAGIIGTTLFASLTTGLGLASRKYRKKSQEGIRDLSEELIEQENEKQMRLSAKKSIDRINKN